MALSFSDPSLVYDINHPLVIEASAGSGKTTILTERWVAVLFYLMAWEGSDASQALASMAALTFSRKAAAEMKERIRIRIDQLFEEEELPSFLGLLQKFQVKTIDISKAAESLKTQKSSIDDMISAALIGTIDSFILSSLRQNPLELEEEQPIEPEEGDAFEAEAQKQVLHTCINSAVPAGVRSAFEKGVALCGLGGWIEFFAQIRKKSSQMGKDAFLQSLEQSGLLSLKQEILAASDISALYTLCIQKPARRLTDALNEEVRHTKDKQGAKADASDPYEGLLKDNKELLALLNSINEENFPALFQKGLSKPYGYSSTSRDEELTALRQKSQEAAFGLADACTSLALSVMMPIDEECQKILNRLRKEEGRTSFSENTETFLRALQAGPMAEKIQSRLRYFFADEFQDTSFQQKEIFSQISQKAVSFYVGDPKQSIYRFRGADTGVFQKTIEEFQDRGWRVEVLKINYRSASSHVAFANQLFAQVFESGPIRYTPQEAFNSGEGDLGYTLLLEDVPEDGEGSQKKASASDKRAQSCVEALAFIRQELAAGTKPGEILVLFRTKKEIHEFYNYLKDKVPGLAVSSSEREGLFQSAYIKPLMAFFRALDNPADELKLITLLKGVFFRKDDIFITSLLEKARAKRCSLYEVLPPEDAALIAPFAALKDRVPLEELLDIFLRQSSYEVLLREDPGEALASLRLFREELQNLGQTKALNLGLFLRMADEGGLKTSEAEFSGGEGKNIRLMTIHASKGLESPCVIYAYKNSKILKSSSEIALKGKIAFYTFGKGRLAEELEAMEEEELFAEEKRLVYVAVTRAKRAFYLCGLPPPPKETSSLTMGHILNKELFEALCPQALVTEFPEFAPLPEKASSTDEPYIKRRKDLFEKDRPFPTYPQSLSVSQLLDAEFSPENFAKKYRGQGFSFSESLRDMGEDNFTFSAPSPADIGTMVHHILQNFDSADPGLLRPYLGLHFPEFEEAFPEVLSLAANYLDSPFFQNLSASAAYRDKERPVQMLLDKSGIPILLRAAADLYIEGGKKLIVDYKLSVGKNTERFKRQLSYYAYLSEEAGYPVDELALFSLREAKEYLFAYEPVQTKAAFDKAVQKALELLAKESGQDTQDEAF